jgi:hypothetical protein
VLSTGHRLGEGERQRLVQVRAPLRTATRLVGAEDLREQVAEGGLLDGVHRRREIEALEPGGRLALSRHFHAYDVVPPAAIRVAQDLVGLRDLAEAAGRDAIARVDVGVEPPRQPAIGALHVVDRRVATNAEDDVEVHVDCRLQKFSLFPSISLHPRLRRL